jgi:hypothetical protein
MHLAATIPSPQRQSQSPVWRDPGNLPSSDVPHAGTAANSESRDAQAARFSLSTVLTIFQRLTDINDSNRPSMVVWVRWH